MWWQFAHVNRECETARGSCTQAATAKNGGQQHAVRNRVSSTVTVTVTVHLLLRGRDGAVIQREATVEQVPKPELVAREALARVQAQTSQTPATATQQPPPQPQPQPPRLLRLQARRSDAAAVGPAPAVGQAVEQRGAMEQQQLEAAGPSRKRQRGSRCHSPVRLQREAAAQVRTIAEVLAMAAAEVQVSAPALEQLRQAEPWQAQQAKKQRSEPRQRRMSQQPQRAEPVAQAPATAAPT